jgi:hypothetical protein
MRLHKTHRVCFLDRSRAVLRVFRFPPKEEDLEEMNMDEDAIVEFDDGEESALKQLSTLREPPRPGKKEGRVLCPVPFVLGQGHLAELVQEEIELHRWGVARYTGPTDDWPAPYLEALRLVRHTNIRLDNEESGEISKKHQQDARG